MMNRIAAATCTVALGLSYASAQTARTTGGPNLDDSQGAACSSGVTLAGIVRDTTRATVAEAAITLEDGTATQTGKDGRFQLRCVADGAHQLHVAATSFAPVDSVISKERRTDLTITLIPEAVQQTVSVDSDGTAGVDNTESGSSRTLQGDALKALADDPDDLLRQLQQLTAGSGGDPDSAIITVDGFQSPSRLPPKSSIAYIRINPDQFAAEYQEPPYQGARVEVYTKPGASRFHGALYMAYGGSALNARDPFSVAKGKLGKQRFGFDLSGPVSRHGSDFAISLEHRSVDNIAAVNAVTLDSGGNFVTTNASVAQPQRLWVASARLGWQLGPKNTFIASYSGSVNNLGNQSVGGTTLPEAGYNSNQYEHNARFINITTISPRVIHEARASLHWQGETDAPQSKSPQLQVAGAFTGGGANIGPRQLRELLLEVYDDAIVTTARHTFKFGTNLRVARERQNVTQDFNGTYVFGGGIAPVLGSSGTAIVGSAATITGLEQYRRALLGLPGGTPTAYTGVTGSPRIDFTQTRASFFLQDDWKLRPNVKLSGGLRYFAQSDPSTIGNIVPRIGIAWSPDKKQTWTLRAHAGMFNSNYSTEDATEIKRLDGTVRTSSIVYSPNYGAPYSGGASQITTVCTVAPGFATAWFNEEQVVVEHTMHGWNVNAAWYWLHLSNEPRVRNINTPINGVRPMAPNLNVLQLQNSGKAMAMRYSAAWSNTV